MTGNEINMTPLGSPRPSSRLDRHRILPKAAFLVNAQFWRDVLQAILFVWLARRSPSAFGLFMLAINMAQILLYLSEFGLNQNLVRRLSERGAVLPALPRREQAGPEALLARINALKAFFLFLGVLGVWGFMIVQNYDAATRQMIGIFSAAIVMESFANSFLVYLRVEGRQRDEGRVRVWAVTLGYGFGLAALFIGLAPAIIALFRIVETAVILVGAVVLFRRAGHRVLRWGGIPGIARMWRESLSFSLIEACATLYNRANVFFLQRSQGAEGVAQYSAALSQADYVSPIVETILINPVLFPVFSRLHTVDHTEIRRLGRSVFRWLSWAGALVTFVLFVESDRLIPLIYGQRFSEAIHWQRVLAFLAPIGLIHNLALYLLMSAGRQRQLLAFHVCGLALNLVLCAIWIPSWPLAGTVYALLVTKVFMLVLTVAAAHRRFALIPGRAVAELLIAIAAGSLLLWAGSEFLPRGFAELLGLLPLLCLGGLWWRAGRQAALSVIS